MLRLGLSAPRFPAALGSFALVPVLWLGASCANMPSTESGFLQGGYADLEPAPDRQVWGIPDEIRMTITPELRRRAEAREIRQVYVEPAVYRPLADARYRPEEGAARRLEGYATRKLKNALAEDFEIVDGPTSTSVTVRLALTDLMNSNVWINSVMTVLLVPVDMGGVSGELEVLDSATGERLAAWTATREGTLFLIFEAFNRHGHVRHGVKKWAKMTRSILQGR